MSLPGEAMTDGRAHFTWMQEPDDRRDVLTV